MKLTRSILSILLVTTVIGTGCSDDDTEDTNPAEDCEQRCMMYAADCGLPTPEIEFPCMDLCSHDVTESQMQCVEEMDCEEYSEYVQSSLDYEDATICDIN